MASPNPPDFSQPQPGPITPAKKTSPLVWILGGLAVVGFGIMLMCGVGGYFLLHKAKNAGFDSALFQKNPGYAGAKLAMTLNPEVEIVSSDDNTGTLTVRNKKNGETSTMRFDPTLKQMVVIDKDGKQSSVRLNDSSGGGLTVQSQNGTTRIGDGSSNVLPSWVPAYPHATTTSSVSSAANGHSTYVQGLKTSDPVKAVVDFYQNQLKSAGFKATQTYTADATAMLIMESDQHKVTITVGGSGSETSISVTAEDK